MPGVQSTNSQFPRLVSGHPFRPPLGRRERGIRCARCRSEAANVRLLFGYNTVHLLGLFDSPLAREIHLGGSLPLRIRCIGIDRHCDSRVPDLSGAARDAIALHALFSDTLAGADIELLTNAQATVGAIQSALDATLGAAGPEDDVILTFAGHGTRDHRLVAHDTTVDAYDASTLPMQALAERFRSTRARSVVCVLDCCFSGGAAARVFADSPVSRDAPFTSLALAGEGRVLITASRVDEPAYEHPLRRHGLLTDALIAVLTGVDGTEVSLATAMDEVLSRVRSEAAAMGCTQTPELVGHITGGLTIPTLRRGAHFASAFPETIRPVIGGAVSELAAYRLPSSVLEAWAERYSEGLNALQLTAVNDIGVLAGESALVIAPTSAGKTFVGEMAAIRAVADGRKAVFLLPYKALVNEKFDEFTDLYGERLGLRVVRCTGDYADQRSLFVNGKYDIALLTFEMFLALAVGNEGVLPRIGLVVLDEAQFIADASRGISVELILTYLRTARAKGVAPQVLALSATIGARNHFDEWLGIACLAWTERPVPLEFGVLDRNGMYESVDASGTPQPPRQFLPRHEVRQRKEKASSQDIVVPLVRQLLADEAAREKILIFRNQRGSAEGCANYLSNERLLPTATEVIEALPRHDRSATTDALSRALAGGAAFHNSNLTREERTLVERAFRDPDGPVRLLAATAGVAAGINTPASTVIIVEHEFPWEEEGEREFSVGTMRNMAGRAGRFGFRETGRAILLADTPLERRRLFERYVMSQPAPVNSAFRDSDVDTWLLRLFAQVDAVPADMVVGLLANTFGGYLAARRDATWQTRVTTAITTLIQRMRGLDLLEEVTDGTLRLTLLGRACGQSSLSLSSALRVVELVCHRLGPLTAERLMALVQALPELDAQYTPVFSKGHRESAWVREAAQQYGSDIAAVLQQGARDPVSLWARAKRACVLDAWCAGETTEVIRSRFTITPFQSMAPGDVRGIADTTRYHLRSAYAIAQLASPADAPDPAEMERLLLQLETGIPADAISLLDLPLTLARGELLALRAAGLQSADAVNEAGAPILERILGAARTEELRTMQRSGRRVGGAASTPAPQDFGDAAGAA